MKKLTKAQQDKLVGIGVGTLVIMGALYFFVIASQQRQLAAIKKNVAKMQITVADASKLVRSSLEVGLDLTNRMIVLQRREEGLAPDHDPYAWMLDRIGAFIRSRPNVNLREMSKEEVSEKGILPHFPYKWATFHLKAVGYYHDIGKFCADFENAYPYFIIQNVEIAPSGTAEAKEKLSYSFDIVSPLVPVETK